MLKIVVHKNQSSPLSRKSCRQAKPRWRREQASGLKISKASMGHGFEFEVGKSVFAHRKVFSKEFLIKNTWGFQRYDFGAYSNFFRRFFIQKSLDD